MNMCFMRKGENSPKSEKILCNWCNDQLNLNDSFEKSVCVACYRQLVKAGFTDEEIFARKIARTVAR
jgi:hypothetical protein